MLAQPDFLGAVDAIGIEDLFSNGSKLQPAEHTKYVLGFLTTMTAAHKPVLVIEYAKSRERQAFVRTQAAKNGFIALVTDRQLKTLGESGK